MPTKSEELAKIFFDKAKVEKETQEKVIQTLEKIKEQICNYFQLESSYVHIQTPTIVSGEYTTSIKISIPYKNPHNIMSKSPYTKSKEFSVELKSDGIEYKEQLYGHRTDLEKLFEIFYSELKEL